MQIDVDCTVCDHKMSPDISKVGMPLIRLYGVTDDSHSVCLIVERFYPYFYVKKPKNFTQGDIPTLKNKLTDLLKANSANQEHCVKEITIVSKIDIFMYNPNPEDFLKIVLYQPKNVSFLRERFEGGSILIDGIDKFDPLTYESKINFNLRYMLDRDIVGMSWVKVPKGKYTVTTNEREKVSNCQIEAWADVDDVIPLSHLGEYSKIAPIRILSILYFDGKQHNEG